MNSKTVLIVGVAAAALLATALAVTSKSGSSSAGATARAPLFPELRERINDVARVVVTDGDGSFAIARNDKGWGAADKGGFPIRVDRLKELTVGISQLEVVDEMTKNPAMHARLELGEPGSGEGAAERVRIEDAAGKVLADVLIGKPKSQQGFGGKGALYVRKAGDDQAWEVIGRVQASASAGSWLVREVGTEVKSARVKRVAIHHADGSTLVVSKASPDDANFAVEDLPEGAELQWPGVANGMASAIEYSNLEDVASAEGFDLAGATTTEYACFDGLVVTARTVEKDGKVWMALAASLDESLRPAPRVGPPATASTDAAEDDGASEDDATESEEAKDAATEEDPAAKLKPLDEVKTEIETLNARWSPWVYQVPGYNAANLRKKLTDLLKQEAPIGGDAASLGIVSDDEADEHAGHDHGDAATQDGDETPEGDANVDDEPDAHAGEPTDAPAPPSDGR